MPQDPQTSGRRLYNALTSRNFDVGTFDEFSKKIQNPQSRQKLYDAVTANGFDVGDFGTFETKLGFRGVPKPSLSERLTSIVAAPGQTLQRGINESRTGNIPAGAADISNAILSTPAVPLGVAAELAGEIPYVGPTIKSGIEGLASIPPAIFRTGTKAVEGLLQINRALPLPIRLMNPALAALSELSSNEQKILGQSPSEYQQTKQSVGGLGSTVSQYAAPVIASSLGAPFARQPSTLIGQTEPSSFQLAGEKLKAKSAQKIGATLGAGESLESMRRSGQFVSEFGIPITGATMEAGKLRPTGSVKSLDVVDRLNQELNSKIIDPATQQGAVVNGSAILDTYGRMRDEYLNSLSPKRASIAILDRLIQSTRERLQRTELPGNFTPRELQDLKVKNNRILEDFYRSIERRGGTLSPEQKVEMQGIARATDEARTAIERLHPDVGKINWTEGAGLEVANAIERYYKKRIGQDPSLARGSGITAAAAGRPAGVGLFGLSELALFKPFRIAYNRFLNQIGTRVSGSPSEFISPGEVQQYSSPPDATRGLLPAAPIITPPPPDASGIRPGTPPFIHYGIAPRVPLLPPAREMPGSPSVTPATPFVPRPTEAGTPQPFTLPDNLRMMPKSSFSIPPAFRQKMMDELGIPRESQIGDVELANLYDLAGLNKSAPLSEAPVSRGGSMSVRGPANQEQIRRAKK